MSFYDTHHDWLRLIEISGPFLAVPVLKEAFPTGLEGLDGLKRKRLRQAYDEWREALESGDPQISELHSAWVDEVLSRGLELDADRRVSVLKRADWCAANLSIDLAEHSISISPDMAVVDELRSNKPLLLVQIFAQETDLDASQKLDGWLATPAERMVHLCRAAGCRLGLVTNGERWMLIDAPIGAVTSFASWYARIWTQEPVTLQAFVHLLGIRRFFGEESEQLPELLDRSLKYQDEVTEALGEQVRRAVEVLIQALDKADQDRNRELLFDVTEPELYEAALTVMMRLVFLLAAEERGLLLMGDECYEANYAVSTLRMQLTAESNGVLERRWDAWSRLLSIFRVVYGGIEHENLRLPALGGSLFDPDRFPFLEGRAKGSSWLTDMAKPLPIDNRTVLLLLRAIQQFQGRTLSYAGLDVEQVGHVYEGLLERTVKRTTEVTLEFDGTKNAKAPWIKLTELELAKAEGVDRLVQMLEGRCGSSASRIRNDLVKPVDDLLSGRLLAACNGDTELRDRIVGYAHLVRIDPWGYPLVYPAGSFIVATSSNRRETGAHYTPKTLTETIVTETLTPVVYIGPAEGKLRDQWVLKSSSEILELKICDPAMGSGAFLVQACRWLAERLVEAWSLAETTGRVVSVDGAVLDAANGKELLPRTIDARTMIARQLIAERCLYGVDLNPLAVELAKLSIWLVTLAKGRPLGFLDHNLRSGNSLLGIHRLDQLTELSMTPTGKGQQRLFGQDIERAVHEAIELRQKLRALPIRDIRDVEAMSRLDSDSRKMLEVPELIADAFIGEVFASGGNANVLAKATASLAIQSARAVDGNGAAIESIARCTVTAFATDMPADKPSHRPFHWPLEFPEVFLRQKPGFDAIIGNPPFMGGLKISEHFRDSYIKFLGFVFQPVGRLTDLCAYFFRQANNLTCFKGVFGFVATNTISQGVTRQGGLDQVIASGGSIINAIKSFKWPGRASVHAATVVVFKGVWNSSSVLNGKKVKGIDALLDEKDEESRQPQSLRNNHGRCYQGVNTWGKEFIITDSQAAELIESNPRNKYIIKPVLGGEEIAGAVSMVPTRWAIDMGEFDEQEALSYPEVLNYLKINIYPSRSLMDVKKYPRIVNYWWRYFNPRQILYKSINEMALTNVFARARTSDYHTIERIPANVVHLDSAVIFLYEDLAIFSVLQSSVHEIWSRKYSSSLGSGMRYIVSACFDTFPFPVIDANSLISQDLSTTGRFFIETRSAICERRGISRSELMSCVYDSSNTDVDIVSLRQAISKLDKSVLLSYGWGDIKTDYSFIEWNGKKRFTLSEEVRGEIFRRLLKLNIQRSDERIVEANYNGGDTKPISGSARFRSTTTTDVLQSEIDFELAPTEAPGTTDTASAILDFLKTRTGWHAKAGILSVTDITDEQWSAAIGDLISQGRVERQGEKRGTRYRAFGVDR
jgi:hypothetical protein